jgi:hypothetical protein
MPEAIYHEPAAICAALSLIEFLSDLFTATGKETFTRGEILFLLNSARDNPELIDPLAVVAYQMATEGI